ncbi:hypothetical protein HPB48_020550 [Haemaphysalis longicornis]|uniref:Uncharacterized protein n=1 Tax=Haemaphysalis longicornis TaxID=44386 RepID=A0A9J6G4Q0_HAELO|nr:hypothetical protein HPB48_020550 [Haemaphysalis longicornis]
MSAHQLEAVDMRLRYITLNVLEGLGGLDMILRGGLRQLPHVPASEIYKSTRNANRVIAYNVKWHVVSYFTLVQAVRQKDAHFTRTLTKIGGGVSLERDTLEHDTPAMATTLAPGAVRLYYSNEAVNAYNVALAKGDPDSVNFLALD